MPVFELLQAGEAPSSPMAELVEWPTSRGSTLSLITDLGWELDLLGDVEVAAADLLRIAVAAYCADRQTPRPMAFSRDIRIVVHLADPKPWRGDAGALVVDTLAWITGDTWTLEPVQGQRGTAQILVPLPKERIMLLSGGLDSFCGAVDQASAADATLHVGHRDSATAVKHAQNSIDGWLRTQVPQFEYSRLQIRQAQKPVEPTSRTRSFLFMALAVAAAVGRNAQIVFVPENGFTSINLPLLASRGGALSTKSTHPWTFTQMQRLLDRAGIDVRISNPYGHLTKGELVAMAAGHNIDGFLGAAAQTLSCAKLDGGRASAGNANLNCGLCIACIVRRSSFLGADVVDETAYLVDVLTGDQLKWLVARRQGDIDAVRIALSGAVTEDDLIASAAWPPGTDLGQVLDLCNRGRKEMNLVPLP